MADIAILLAEEYERRTRSIKSKFEAAGGDRQEISLLSSLAAVLDAVKIEEKLQVAAVRLLDPKTALGQEAFNGFFSA